MVWPPKINEKRKWGNEKNMSKMSIFIRGICALFYVRGQRYIGSKGEEAAELRGKMTCYSKMNWYFQSPNGLTVPGRFLSLPCHLCGINLKQTKQYLGREGSPVRRPNFH